MKNILQKGQIGLVGIVVTGVLTIFGSIFTARIAANDRVDERVNAVDTRVQLIDQRENLHYIELQKGQASILEAIKDLQM